MNILQLNASILGDNSVTRQLTDKVVSNLAGDDDQVIHRDLVTTAIPHLDAEILMAA
ncbi:NAD(P)H-dependent oxidoreductase, partial [Idiomarina xiamenensis]